MKTVTEFSGIVLREAKMSYTDVVTVQVYLTYMSLFQKMNDVYLTYSKTDRPTRTTLGITKLAIPEAHVEITVTARH